jgi:hypothetical protein
VTCDALPEGCLATGCSLFTAWGWTTGNPTLEYKVVDCPARFQSLVKGAFGADGVDVSMPCRDGETVPPNDGPASAGGGSSDSGRHNSNGHNVTSNGGTSRRGSRLSLWSLVMLLVLSATLMLLPAESAIEDSAQAVAAESESAESLAFLQSLADYATHLHLPTNSLVNESVPMDGAGGTDHIFVNGNLARVLISAYRLLPRTARTQNYLTQALAWCDTFVSLQADIPSSQGNPAGYWGVGYGGPPKCTNPLRGNCAHGGDIYFGDTGTAVTALAQCWWSAPSSSDPRRADYLAALRKYATFVLEGSSVAPYNKKGTVTTFMPAEFDGAVGCGYYKSTNRTSENCVNVPGASWANCPSTHPYTIATATTGGAFFAELYKITGNYTYATVAARAMDYDASVVLRHSTGEVPYILDGANCTTAFPGTRDCKSVGGPWPFDTVSYVAEGVAAVALHLPPSGAIERTNLVRQWRPTVDFILKEQNVDGFWGQLGKGDLMRSPRCLTLLNWWVHAVDTPTYRDQPAHEAIERYLTYVIKHASPEYGLRDNTMTTGMVGLAVADSIRFGSTFGGGGSTV